MPRTRHLLPILAGLIFLAIFPMLLSAPHAAASAGPYSITGFGWSGGAGPVGQSVEKSGGIGWISFNCTTDPSGCGGPAGNWGIAVDAGGALSGQAWSENIGWISADPADVNYCVANFGGVNPQISGSGGLVGWLRALAGTDPDSGGWDGCISLSGNAPLYGPILTGGNFSGYAWGGNVDVGWINFQSDPGDPAGISNAHSDFVPGHTCTCGGPGNQKIYDNGTYSGTTCTPGGTPDNFCSPGSCVCIASPPAGALSLPSVVPVGSVAYVAWNVASAASCTVDSTNGDSWTMISSGAPTGASCGAGIDCAVGSSCFNLQCIAAKTSFPISMRTTFTLTCTKNGGTSIVDQKEVTVTPIFRER